MSPRQASETSQRFTKAAFLGLMIFGLAMITTLEVEFRGKTPDKLHFQSLSSEILMQTVSAGDLRDHPLESLWFLHIQPPAFDTLRAVIVNMLVRIAPNLDDRGLLRFLDAMIYNVWALLYAAMGAMIFIMLNRSAGGLTGLVGAMLFFFHPAAIFYATLLDATMLSSFAILLFFMILKNPETRKGDVFPLALSLLFLFFTRSLFQWPFVVLCAFSLYLLDVPKRAIRSFFFFTSMVIIAFLTKQYLLFGLATTTSFTGLSISHTVDLRTTYNKNPYLENPGFANATGPSVLYRKRKINGTVNLNHVSFLRYNNELLETARKKLLSDGIWQLFRRTLENIDKYLLPSSNYSRNFIVDSLFWRQAFDRVFSGMRLVMLLLLAAAIRMTLNRRRTLLRHDVAILLPVFYIFLASILLDRGENMRFKFFIEPLFIVFIVSQTQAVIHAFIGAEEPHEK
ncbi:MAG: hypothetical protein HQM09_21585 [Candidatus Riflebacteria bacterium]|nr:hypothetical protein [Candidatus Riflebacteria bacterium]